LLLELRDGGQVRIAPLVASKLTRPVGFPEAIGRDVNLLDTFSKKEDGCASSHINCLIVSDLAVCPIAAALRMRVNILALWNSVLEVARVDGIADAAR
jgi:hypothetical protein